MVTICIASIGRPSLVSTLRSIEQVNENYPNLTVLVADDSPNGEAERLIGSVNDWRIPISVRRVGSKNISTARNACLDGAQGIYAAFIDDDEWAHSLWLNDMVGTAAKYRADAVFGSVEPHFPNDTPSWLSRSGIFRKKSGSNGAAVATGSTSNAVVSLAAIKAAGIRFNESLGRTGGEDTEFFYRLGKSGASLVACDRGVVYEEVPRPRLSIRHLWVRYTRGGYTYASIMTGHSSRVGRASFFTTAAVKLIYATCAAAVSLPMRRDLAFSYSLQACGNFGKILFICGCASPRPYN